MCTHTSRHIAKSNSGIVRLNPMSAVKRRVEGFNRKVGPDKLVVLARCAASLTLSHDLMGFAQNM